MKYTTLLIGLALSGLYACSGNPIDFASTEETTITGNTCALNNALANIPATNVLSSLPSGSQALLNASGSLHLTNQVFTYSGFNWTTDFPVQWSTLTGTAEIVAIYPANETYSYENLYQEGKLRDILYVKDTFTAGDEIRFKFKHLFSYLTFRISPELQNDLQELSLKTPVCVSHISPESAEVDLATESHTSSIAADGSEYYSFIIPPAENISLVLTLKTNEETFVKQLNAQNFSGNMEYTCHIRALEGSTGIETAEDLIAFAMLINKDKSYKGDKTLEDFGDTKDGVPTYRLLNDITLTEADNKRLQRIGMAPAYAFNDTFDGMEHTIYNFNPTTSNKGYCGLFGSNTTTGVIKNLRMDQATSTLNDKSSLGILIGTNNGTLINCTVTNSNITEASESQNIGILTGSCQGTIINCNVQSCTIKGGNTVGIAAGISSGKIINCFFANNSISAFKDFSGGICGECSSTQSTLIANCYSSCTTNKTSKFGAIAGNPYKVVTQNCFYDETGKYAPFAETGSGKKDVYSYNENFTTSIGDYSVLDKLNEWVETNISLYPTLNRWTAGDETLPAIFIKKQ
ncbi:fimbrillin family protein [Phocaeicola sp.]